LQFLELEPQMLHVLRQFNAGDYEKCLTALNDLRPNLMLDLYLARHVSTLYDMIRKRGKCHSLLTSSLFYLGMVSFFAPYMCADMRIMARAFNTTVTLLQDELCVLIFEEKIKVIIHNCEVITSISGSH
jgi:COP9 signalosome complex subunit 1